MTYSDANMTDQVEALRELSLEECEDVAGGIIPVFTFTGSAVLGAAITGVNGGIAAGSLIKLLGSLTGGGNGSVSYPTGGFGSDRRIKRDIVVEGHLDHLGLDVYSWEYVSAPGERFVGVMAQDVLARKDLSKAVFTFKEGPFEGFYGVDYAALGLNCIPAEAFDGDVSSLIAQEIAFA